MVEGPWIFRGYALMMVEFDGATPIPAKLPCSVRVWVQIHKIPPLYRREVISVEMKVVSIGIGDFYRARVNLDATKSLVRFVTLAPEGCDPMHL